MKKRITILIIVLLSLAFIISSTADIPTMSWINECHQETEPVTKRISVIKTGEYTCPTIHFQVYPVIKYARCYDKDPMEQDSKLLYHHYYEYGYIANRTMYWTYDSYEGTYIDYINSTVCDKVGAIVGNREVDFKKCNIMCSKEDTIIQCDSCRDGNCDGIKNSGESGFVFDLNNLNWYTFEIISDSTAFKHLKECSTRIE